MRQKNTETTQLVIPVAGAGNFGSGKHSTAAIHLAPLTTHLGHTEGRVVVSPLVPSGLGLCNLEKTFQRFCEQVDSLSERYPAAEIVLVGHSLGGLLARRQSAEQPGRFKGVVTLGTPHGPLNSRLPHVYRETYGVFAKSIPEHVGEKAIDLACIASRFDEMVPVSSAQLSLPGVDNYTVGNKVPITHNLLPVVPSVTALTRNIVGRMLNAETPALQAGLPDLALPA